LSLPVLLIVAHQKSLLELKLIIKNSLDKRIKVVVMRDNKEKELKMKIPKELPKE